MSMINRKLKMMYTMDVWIWAVLRKRRGMHFVLLIRSAVTSNTGIKQTHYEPHQTLCFTSLLLCDCYFTGPDSVFKRTISSLQCFLPAFVIHNITVPCCKNIKTQLITLHFGAQCNYLSPFSISVLDIIEKLVHKPCFFGLVQNQSLGPLSPFCQFRSKEVLLVGAYGLCGFVVTEHISVLGSWLPYSSSLLEAAL